MSWRILLFAVLGVVFLMLMGWVMCGMDRKPQETTTIRLALILDAYSDKKGLVLTVAVSDGRLYRLYTNATGLNVSEPIAVIFEKEVPVFVVQSHGKDYEVYRWEVLRTLEDIPEVRR